MKCRVRGGVAADVQSLPVRGAWIEMFLRRVDADGMKSLPVRGAWIEMPPSKRMKRMRRVAPRAGSVD